MYLKIKNLFLLSPLLFFSGCDGVSNGMSDAYMQTNSKTLAFLSNGLVINICLIIGIIVFANGIYSLFIKRHENGILNILKGGGTALGGLFIAAAPKILFGLMS